jgi:beta-aspartyl-peptidase (threonine type)
VAERVKIGGESLQQALDDSLADIQSLGGTGGMIAVAPTGEMAWGFTTPGMSRGKADSNGRTIALYADSEER